MNEYIAALVDEFYQLGVRHAVFSPGSRSTTMAMLFTEYEGFETYMNIDERSASFMALGIAKAYKEPTVLVCTSGSAVAHYLPAILEAQYSGVPLIVLSADRPHTLLHVGAPQTVDQQKIFGTAVNYYEELAVPQEDHYYTYPRQVARKAYMKAMDIKKGPVHINVPLFEPLVPELDRKHFEAGRSPYKVFKPNYGDVFSYQKRSNNTSNPSNVSKASNVSYTKNTTDNNTNNSNRLLAQYKKVLILAGPQIDVNEVESIHSFAENLQAPILADPLSNVRRWHKTDAIDDNHEFNINRSNDTDMTQKKQFSDVVISTYDAFLADKELWPVLKPDCVIQFGQMVVSKRVQQMVASWDNVEYIEVNPTMDSMNPTGKTTMHMQASIDMFTHLFAVKNESNAYLNRWQRLEVAGKAQLSTAIEEPSSFEGRTIRELQQHIPDNSQVLVANSMTIRDFDYFWFSGESDAVLYGNRGVNGIDGTVSTALGLATNGKSTYLVTGDLSLFHDLNGLAVAKTQNLNLTIILHNNDGGGIFEYLPQKGTKHFDYLFSTSQGLDYSGAAKLYGCGYTKIINPDELSRVLAKVSTESGVHIIEIPTDREYSRQLHKKYTKVSVDMEALL
ncbi:2-succinyl-6-hydroxy-2,4-cyclohexadiene-1- carboxylic acid synthase/2-oxoglutarate decarboxylase [Veillonella parvula DSM 2008]|uniref:2-succinyl-5-enolpyruvyl-6-hydroxy-3- cyclohexene-1-carboxylic-acid synthase n=1 Tax=Veillonella parvula TaxID=29466 RepID=UPI00019C0255|nr:2-succinyl-5-enolpyruvyl-6-hydroxy-3-cyclohexene-1-carboxylic-acid synthase [Veillonella parvula]ACZ24058.1 2-succinyl-6-hydroxy-2,4-cyclohexadiene-1- carboxylic acid synthase/2-oxoglutarate decarboxylase [Veillonella parvula DSM 2008]QQB16667.1 2-succinyl-5-enolpyruvyl-6-hydroxy-3-cyclohexene-1-carboxylic-acid synthase [Veillonella parvula]SNU94959.1 2-succinyl-5-enolpyruvyl-6-hydroxy-3-cyclohexene-1-carboxylate synthase [Veillonella parvula]